MRHYQTDSAQAAARVLALALLADGGLDQAELRSLAHAAPVRRLGLSDETFETVLRNYCQDLEQATTYLDATHLHLSPEVVELLLDEIQDPELRHILLDAMREIVSANGVISADEAALLATATERWAWPRGTGNDDSIH